MTQKRHHHLKLSTTEITSLLIHQIHHLNIAMLSLSTLSHVRDHLTRYSEFVLNTGIICLASNRARMKPSLARLPQTDAEVQLLDSHSVQLFVCGKDILPR